MATDNPVESLREEATCPICLEYFKDPVIIECGHNFCRACIAQCWEGSDTAASCPQCRETVQQRNLRPNRQLANVTLKLFCEEDQTSICLVCHLSRAHRAHRVVPLEEAAQEYKERIQAHLKTLRKEREKVPQAPPMSLTSPCPIFIQKQTQTERQKIVSEFQRLRQFLEEQERLLLAQLEKLDEEIVRIQNENVSKLSKQISHLGELIMEMEGKCQKPASEFLQVRLNGIAQWFEHWPTKPRVLDLMTFWAHVTLDPDTAHPNLVLSEDRKSVRWEDTEQDLPDNPERFDYWECVLGCEGFTSGRHCWEVEVGGEEGWAVGVARESVGRKGGISHSPEGGIWAVERWGGQFRALTSPETPLPLSRVPSRIRVCLDCDRGSMLVTRPRSSLSRRAPSLGGESDPGSGCGRDPGSDCVPETHGRGGNWKSASLASWSSVFMTLEDSHLRSLFLLISLAAGSTSPALSAASGMEGGGGRPLGCRRGPEEQRWGLGRG
uniref:Zinc finger protein RFP-like n=1 Tax=Chelonoidis abingdonii TaxID=106734 RepID=A0A8C0H891_CHEAB